MSKKLSITNVVNQQPIIQEVLKGKQNSLGVNGEETYIKIRKKFRLKRMIQFKRIKYQTVNNNSKIFYIHC